MYCLMHNVWKGCIADPLIFSGSLECIVHVYSLYYIMYCMLPLVYLGTVNIDGLVSLEMDGL